MSSAENIIAAKKVGFIDPSPKKEKSHKKEKVKKFDIKRRR